MPRDYGTEIDAIQKELSELKGLLAGLVQKGAAGKPEAGKAGDGDNEPDILEEVRFQPGKVVKGMHPDQRIDSQMEEMCEHMAAKGITGEITYLGVFLSGGRQSNWIRKNVDTGKLLELIENRTAGKVLSCLGNNDRLNILLAILKRPMSVAEIVTECKLGSTGQAYHHMKPLLAADLIEEENMDGGKGIYVVQPHKVQGIIMLLAGIADMVDETFTKGNWDEGQEE